MSDYRREAGKVKLIYVGDDIDVYTEDYCKRLVNIKYDKNVKELPRGYNSWFELYNDYGYARLVLIKEGNRLWEVSDIVRKDVTDTYCDLEEINEYPDVTEFRFDTQYYDGGTCMEEMLAEELKKIKI